MKKVYDVKDYPNFPEYKLLEIYPADRVNFKRGNTYDHLFAEDYLAWQDYFCSDYQPPEEKDILLFHSCSWSKPYDFSFIIKPIRELTKKYERVHRVVMSNVGVIPYEYQMNPTFCCYDCPPTFVNETMSPDAFKEYKMKYVQTHYDRVYRYINQHKDHYKKVIVYGAPVQYTGVHVVGLVCKELGIPFESVISKELYQNYKNKAYEDSGELFIEPEILIALENVLKSSCER